MFDINDGAIRISKGDTASFDVTATGYTFGENDRALFTIKSGDGTIIFQNAYPMENGSFRVDFHNSDTDKLATGAYSYDVRYVVNPVYDEEGKIVDGDVVSTPKSASTFTILPVVGEI